MAPQIWLLRHGDAEAHGERDDASRRLTARGEDQARAAGAALARLELGLESVLTSPRVRARETARLACAPLDLEPEVHEPLSGGFSREDALAVLAGANPEARLLLVGHEPDFSQLLYDFAGARADVKKGGVAGLRVARGAGELLALLRPRELEAIAAGSGRLG